MSVNEYLEWEEAEVMRHEYVGGVVYAMAGGTNNHQEIASNTLGALHSQLRGKPCRPYNFDTKVRIEYPTHTGFYYPDAMVVCDRSPAAANYQDHPVVIVEVLWPSTRRTDESEKRDAYYAMGSLRVYVLLEQERVAAVVCWRVD